MVFLSMLLGSLGIHSVAIDEYFPALAKVVVTPKLVVNWRDDSTGEPDRALETGVSLKPVSRKLLSDIRCSVGRADVSGQQNKNYPA